MKFGIRTPSLRRRIAARTSIKRYVRHSLGLKAPRGMGYLTNPKRAVYNRVYNRTSVSVDRLIAGSGHSRHARRNAASDASFAGLVIALLLLVGVICAFAAPPVCILLLVGVAASHFLPGNAALRARGRAARLLEAHRFEEAANMLAPVHKTCPDDVETTRLLGLSLHDGHKFAEALPLLNETISRHPDDWFCLLIAADCCYQTGAYREALAFAQRIPEQAEDVYVRALNIRGLSFYKLGEADLAIEVLKKAPLLKRNLDDVLKAVHYNLGIVYESQGKRREALRQFKRVYKQDSAYSDVAAKVHQLQETQPASS